jgi:hypothetical protein
MANDKNLRLLNNIKSFVEKNIAATKQRLINYNLYKEDPRNHPSEWFLTELDFNKMVSRLETLEQVIMFMQNDFKKENR